MALKFIQQLKKDKEVLQTLEKKEKWPFIWDYYKIPIISFFCVVALVLMTIFIRFGSGDSLFYAVLINADEGGDKSAFTKLLDNAGYDRKGRDIDVNDLYTLIYQASAEGDESQIVPAGTADAETMQVLAALFGIGDLDLFVANESVFETYHKKEAFADLRKLLDASVVASYETVEKTIASADQSETYTGVYGVYLPESSALHRAGFYHTPVVVGIAQNAQNMEEALAFLKALLEDGAAPR